jgi:PAS domain S-box-containing protein
MILDHQKITRIKNSLKLKPHGLSISEIATNLHLNRNSVAKYLEILLMNGEVEAKKQGTSRVYTISQRVPVSGWISFSSDLIIIVNTEGEILQANDSFLKFSNTASEEILGKHINDLHNPLFCEVPLEHFLKGSHEKKTEYFEISLDAGGKTQYFKGKLIPIIFEGGDDGVLILFENISDHKRAVLALAEREQQYRAVIENIQDVFYRSNLDGNLIMASPSWASMLEYDSLDECLGKNIAENFYWEPERRKQFLDAVYTKGRVKDYEVILKTKDGRPFYVSTNSHLYFDDSGNILGVEGIFRDMNEYHASQEKIRSHISHMEFFSNALQEFIEHSSDFDIFEKIGKDLYSLIPDAMVDVNSYNHLTGKVTIKSVNPPQQKEICEQILGRDLVGVDLPINSLALNTLRDGHLHKINITLHDAAFRSLPLSACQQIEQTLNLGENYTLGFARGGELFGNVTIFLPKNKRITDIEFIEAYGRAASIALQRKITEIYLRDSQEIFQSVAQESPYPLAIIDKNGNFRYINHSFTRTFGYDLGDFLSGRQWFLLTFPDPDYRKQAIALWKSDIAAYSQQGTIPREFTVRCKKGNSKVIIFRMMVLSTNEKCIICEDITERRESEKTRKLLSCIVGSSHDAIIGKKIDGSIISWNHAAEDMYGYSLQEIIGKNISVIVPFERREELEKILKRISSGEGVTNFETTRLKKDGTRIDVSVTISPIIDDTGAVIGASTISHDNKFRRSEELFRENEEKYRLLVDNIHCGVYRSTGDSRGRFISGNTQLVKILGFPSFEKLQEIDISEIFVETGGRKKLLDELKKAGCVKDKEILLQRADGSTLIASVTGYAKFNQDGNIEYVDGIIEDITEQKQYFKQSEVLWHELIDIIDFLPDPTFLIDNEHRVIAWNSAIEQMTGVRKNEILGCSEFTHAFPFYGTSQKILIDLVDAPDDEVKKYYPDLKREGRSLVAKIFAPSLYSGKGAYLLARASPLCDPEKGRIGAIEVIRDISQVQELQELLKSAKNGFISETLRAISTPYSKDPAHSEHDGIKPPGVLSLLYLSNALKLAHDSISILDLSGRCIWVNDTFMSIISLKKNNAVIGKSFAQFIAPEDRKIALDCLIDVRKSGNKRILLSLVTSSGRVPAEASLSSITDNEDEILGYLTIIRPIDQDRIKLYSGNSSFKKTSIKK